MVTSSSHLSSVSPFSKYHSPTLKFTQVQPKPNLPPTQYKLHTNLHETQQLHGHFIKTSTNFSYQVPLPALESYSSNASFYSFLITSYINNNCPEDAAKIYSCMLKKDTEVDNFIIPSVLKACCLIPSTLLGQQVHGFVVKNGFYEDVFVCNALTMMYSEVGRIASARLLFDRIGNKDVVSWSIMIRSCGRSGLLDEALELWRDMRVIGIKPSEIAMISIIEVFAEITDLKLRKVMHAYVIRNCQYGKLGVSISTALIDMYVKCKNLAYARRIFDGLSEASVISWTTMISAYIHFSNLNEGLRLFVKMLEEGMFPNEITILSLVKECETARALKLGKWLHAFTLRNGFVISLVLATAFIDMYGKCGNVRSARSVFNSTENKDLTMWSAMISAYVQTNCMDEAFDIFIQMTSCGIRPNERYMVSLLVLCGKNGSLEMGKWIHAYIDKQGIKGDVILETSLVDMYAKCGDIDTAHRIFVAADDRDVSMWNAMISGFAMHGHGEEALELFEEMEEIGVIPNEITFIGALHACSHSGLLQEGKKVFKRMVHDFKLVPKVEHYGCMVDLLGRAGLLEEAQELIKDMPIRPNEVVLGSFLAACKLHKNDKLGEWVAEQFLSLEPHKCGYNVLLSNIYAEANRWGDVADIRRAMKEAGMSKEPGVSSIEVNGSVHEFIMGDREHPESRRIYKMVDEMRGNLEGVGYTPDVSSVLLNMEKEAKETALTITVKI